MQEELTFTLIITGIIIIYSVYVMISGSVKKLPAEFLFLLNKYGFKIKVLERDLKELCKDGGLDYGTIIFIKMQEITMQCEDYRLTPYQYAENEIRNIRTNKILGRNQKRIVISTIILGLYYLIKDYEDVYDGLMTLQYNDEIKNFTEHSTIFAESNLEIKRFIEENKL